MPDIGYVPATRPGIALRRSGTPRRRPTRGRAVLAAAFLAGAALATLATQAAEAAHATQAAGPELTRLLRAMAGLKLMFAAAALAAAWWRLAAPASTARLAGYATAAAAMAAGPVLIWNMAHVPLGALLLHGGLLATALLLWRDPAVSARLSAIIAERRATIRART